ncbi:hypothetical protein GCM10020260_07470 [Nesterenkonia halobia]|uniref:Uncharacterized protein n=1 Tax=Nesterenkonia halobia TaxID=37922 RepID=A0ABP6RBD7_9MICC
MIANRMIITVQARILPGEIRRRVRRTGRAGAGAVAAVSGAGAVVVVGGIVSTPSRSELSSGPSGLRG